MCALSFAVLGWKVVLPRDGEGSLPAGSQEKLRCICERGSLKLKAALQ